jgi:hypothetical protein
MDAIPITFVADYRNLLSLKDKLLGAEDYSLNYSNDKEVNYKFKIKIKIRTHLDRRRSSTFVSEIDLKQMNLEYGGYGNDYSECVIL